MGEPRTAPDQRSAYMVRGRIRFQSAKSAEKSPRSRVLFVDLAISPAVAEPGHDRIVDRRRGAVSPASRVLALSHRWIGVLRHVRSDTR